MIDFIRVCSVKTKEMIGKSSLLLLLFVFSSSALQSKSRLTFDEFFDYTTFSIFSFSPNGQYLLFQTRQPSWNASSYEYILWIYDTTQQTRRWITKNPAVAIAPQWSPNGEYIALFLDETSSNETKKTRHHRSLFSPEATPKEQRIYLYSLASNEFLPMDIGKDVPLAITWADDDSTVYLATTNLPSTNEDEKEWRDVIQYRESLEYEQSAIHRLDIHRNGSLMTAEKNTVANVSFFIGELLYIPGNEKLIFSSLKSLIEDLHDFDLYTIELRNPSSLIRLTDNEAFESQLTISEDKQHLTYISSTFGSTPQLYNDSQPYVYSLNLITGQTTQRAKNFPGNILEYSIKSNGDLYFVGQLGTQVQVYLQRSLSDEVIPLRGWNGTYISMVASRQNSFAFVHSSTQRPMGVYFVKDIDQLLSAKAITDENKLFTERDLPRTTVYQWKNPEDQQLIEGILHYPPGQFEAKNLPLLVLIHGGPYAASVDQLVADWYTWAPLAASEGWLVLEPNYRGSSGYGDGFLAQVRFRPLSLPGKDILYGVDQLVRDGLADPNRLSVGGYSYGGIMTNWLITQTKRFNAALSGAGAIDHISAWGTMDLPVLLSSIFGGYPWESSHVYQSEAPMFQLDRVRTPTLISTGEEDVRVPASQSYMLERGLYYRGVPVKLILFPNEGHPLSEDPWHGKIKVREELKWLHKYGHQSSH